MAFARLGGSNSAKGPLPLGPGDDTPASSGFLLDDDTASQVRLEQWIAELGLATTLHIGRTVT